MGSGASTLKKDMTEVGIKNDIGALYDGESKRFDAAATEGPDGLSPGLSAAKKRCAGATPDTSCIRT